MIRFVISLIFTLLTSMAVYCQDEDSDKFHNDISINATTLLGNLFSLNTNDTGVPYLISYRRHNGNVGVRLSMAGNFSKTVDFFNDASDSYLNLRVGFEKIKPVGSKFTVSYGVDAMFNYLLEQSLLFTTNDIFVQKDLVREIGLGPSVRLHYNINPRVSFHTESSLYAFFGVSETTYDSSFIEDEFLDTYRISFAIPQALFITIAF